MWDFHLYAMNMFYYQRLIKEAVSSCRRTDYRQAGRDKERVGRVREMLCSGQRRKTPMGVCLNLAGRPRPFGDAQINRDWLIEDIRAS